MSATNGTDGRCSHCLGVLGSDVPLAREKAERAREADCGHPDDALACDCRRHLVRAHHREKEAREGAEKEVAAFRFYSDEFCQGDETAEQAAKAMRDAVVRERERADAAEARAAAFTALGLRRLNMESGKDGWHADMEVKMTPEAREAFACAVAAILDSSDPPAVNYVEMRVVHPAGREYAVLCQRVEGKSPAQKASEEKARAERAEAALTNLIAALHVASERALGLTEDEVKAIVTSVEAARAALAGSSGGDEGGGRAAGSTK